MFAPHELLGFMSPALAAEILTYVFESDKPTYHITLNAVAEAHHVRAVFLERQPKTRRHATMLATLTRPTLDLIAANLIRAWLVKKHKAMLVDFLNALEIKNEEGVVENLPATIDDAKLKTAVDGLLSKYPPETVSVYLHAFNNLNEANWPNLKAMLASEPRLQLGAHC